MSDVDVYFANRGCWVLGERADAEKRVLFSHKGVVKMVVAIESTSSNRRTIVGQILHLGDRVFDIYVGGQAPVQGIRNPITCVDDPRFDRRDCACGCGGAVTRGDWIPGHDHKALHRRIAQIGSAKQFIDWFDQHGPKTPDAS